MEKKQYKLEIQSDPKELSRVENFVDILAQESRMDPDKIPGFLLSVTEAITNAIIHGNKKDSAKIVTLNAFLEENKLVLHIKDQGAGFDPSKIPDPTEPENLLKDSGRGLYLMRYHAESLTYNITPEGTETILTLSLNSKT